MWEVGGSIPGPVKQKVLKFWGSAALLTAQPIRVRDRLASWESGQWCGLGHHGEPVVWCFRVLSLNYTGRRSDEHKTGPVHTPIPTYMALFIAQAIELVTPCSSRYETKKRCQNNFKPYCHSLFTHCSSGSDIPSWLLPEHFSASGIVALPFKVTQGQTSHDEW